MNFNSLRKEIISNNASVKELVNDIFAKIDHKDPEINSFICTTKDNAFLYYENSISEDVAISSGVGKSTLRTTRGTAIELTGLSSADAMPDRTLSGIKELDLVLGGGLVGASAILVAGDPGIGKSTLLLQAAVKFSQTGLKTLYISGEEANAQIQLRAKRLDLSGAQVFLGAETNLHNILTTLREEKPDLQKLNFLGSKVNAAMNYAKEYWQKL